MLLCPFPCTNQGSVSTTKTSNRSRSDISLYQSFLNQIKRVWSLVSLSSHFHFVHSSVPPYPVSMLTLVFVHDYSVKSPWFCPYITGSQDLIAKKRDLGWLVVGCPQSPGNIVIWSSEKKASCVGSLQTSRCQFTWKAEPKNGTCWKCMWYWFIDIAPRCQVLASVTSFQEKVKR